MDDAENPDRAAIDTESSPSSPAPIAHAAGRGALSETGAQSANNREPAERRIREWIQVSVNTSLALIGVIAVCIYGGQLREMKKAEVDTHTAAEAAKDASKIARDTLDSSNTSASDTLAEMKKQSKAMQDATADAGKQAKAAETQAKNSFISITATQNAMRLEQRAWVSVAAVTLDSPEAGKPLNVIVGWKNNGRTFAKNATPLTHHVLIPVQVTSVDALMRVPGLIEPERRTVGVLAPGGEYKTVMKSSAVINELDKSNFGTWFIYIWGEMRYEDIFHQPHHTSFCLWRQGESGEFVQCSFHNDAD